MTSQPDSPDDRALLVRAAGVVKRMRRVAPFIGMALLVAAIVFVVRGDTLQAALGAMRRASVVTVALMLASMLASVVLTGIVFWLLTLRFAPPARSGAKLSFWEMQALMASTTLANYLPLRPGLVGRIVYHRTRHAVRARDSLRTVVEAMGLSVLALVTAILMMALARQTAVSPLGLLLLPFVVGVVAVVAKSARLLLVAGILRYAETLLTALRYHLAFQLIGLDVPMETSVAIACVSMIATMVPLVSNGIGLREWAIGLLAPILTGYTLADGIVAELVQRVFEIAVVIPTGLVGGWLLLRWTSTSKSVT